MSDSQSSTTVAQSETTDAVYNGLDDDQWRKPSRASADEPNADSDRLSADSDALADADIPADADPMHEQADHGVVIQSKTTETSAVADSLEQCGYKPSTGEPIVANVAAHNGSAALDARTDDGLGQEFGVWGKEFIATGKDSVMPRPSGSGLAAAERMAGEKAELDRINDIHDRFNIPTYCHCGGPISYLSGEFRCEECGDAYADRDGIVEQATDRAERNRTSWDVTDGLRTRIIIRSDMYDEDFRNQLRGRDALPDDIMLPPAERKHAFANDNHVPRHKPFDHTMVESPEPIACPWADRENGKKTPTAYPSDLLQLEKDVRKRVHNEEREAAVEQLLIGTDERDGVLTRLEPDKKWHDLTAEDIDDDEVTRRRDRSPALREMRRAVYDALEDNGGDPDNALFDVMDELYHPGTTCISNVEPWWSAASTKVKVTELYEPRSPSSQYQVAEVAPINPYAGSTTPGSRTAKLTIWHRSNIAERHEVPHQMLREGDVVKLKNIKPGKFRNQLTLAFTSESQLIRVNHGDGPATSYADAIQPDADAEYSRQDREAVRGGKTVSQLQLPRYRRPSVINVEDLDYLATSGAQQGPTKKYKDLGHQLISWQYPVESCPLVHRQASSPQPALVRLLASPLRAHDGRDRVRPIPRECLRASGRKHRSRDRPRIRTAPGDDGGDSRRSDDGDGSNQSVFERLRRVGRREGKCVNPGCPTRFDGDGRRDEESVSLGEREPMGPAA